MSTQTEEAYRQAEQRIATAIVEGYTELSLGISGLKAIPASIAKLAGLGGLTLQDASVSDLMPLASLTRLEHLDLQGTSVSDLTSLAGLTKLESLDLKGTSVSDLTPLASLTRLEHLDLQGTSVSDLTPLGSLIKLRYLDVQDASVSDLMPLTGLTRLERLVLQNTTVSEIMPLAGLTELKHLDLQRTTVSDLAPLAHLPGIMQLDLQGTSVSDISPVADMRSIQFLSLQGAPVSDLSPLTNLLNLEFLNLIDVPVYDLSPLSNLLKLEFLNLQGMPVSDLSPLNNFATLRYLYLHGVPVSDLSPLADLRSLVHLDLSDTLVSDLAPLANLGALETLYLEGTPASDVRPLANLSGLEILSLEKSSVADLRPLKGVNTLLSKSLFVRSGLIFQSTPATKLDPKLHELSLIENSEDRTRKTLDYLNTLGDDWPPGSAVAEDRPGAPVYTMPKDGGPVRALEEAPDGWDEAQHVLHEQVRQKAGWLIDAISPDSNQHARLRQVAVHYLDNVSSTPEEIGLSALWSSGNTLRQEWKIHQKAEQQGYPEDELPPRIAGMLEDLVTTHGAFVMGFPNAQALEYRQRDYVSSATTSADRATVEVAMNELSKSIHAEQGVVDQQTRNALSDDHLAASREGPDADMARNSLRDRLWNIVGAVGRGLWVGMKVVSTGVAGNIITEFVLANAAKIQAFLNAVNDTAAWWFPHLVTALRAFVGV